MRALCSSFLLSPALIIRSGAVGHDVVVASGGVALAGAKIQANQVMQLNTGDVSINRRGASLGIDFSGVSFVTDLGIGLPVDKKWQWSFDGSLKLVEEREGRGSDSLGKYLYLSRAYAIPSLLRSDVPLVQQQLRIYSTSSGPDRVLVETRVLEDLRGISLEDSFYHTTFNSPVLLFPEDSNYLAYTWGLIGVESSRDGGHFPEAVTGRGISSIPSKLRRAGYSSREDLSTISEKPFGPLVVYDDDGRTLVVSPFDHFLISPLRMLDTPSGKGVARGLHGSVDMLPRGTTTRTVMIFGQGVVETMMDWGDWLLEAGGKGRDTPLDNPLLGGVGFWNCFGGYYTELFRKVKEENLKELAAHFRKEGIPVGYFGLDLWYNYDQVGFAKNYQPDGEKYPQGLEPVFRETGLPYLLHMSAFESPNDYIGPYEFAVDQSSAYPTGRELYDDLARDFKKWGAFGVWPDFLRTQLQNSRSLRSCIGNADRWFDDLAEAFGDQGMVMMMCMPTIGHYLASTRHHNVVAVRTHSDYMNHQKGQVEALRATGHVRNFLPPQQSIRHNLLVSLLAHALGLSPSYDVFVTNATHPEGFAEPNAEVEALLRAMSAGVVAVGDKAGFIDVDIIGKLCFPDGRTSRPDHPPLPVVSTLQSDVLGFYTTTSVGGFRWLYLALFNVGEEPAHYTLGIQELCAGEGVVVYDYFAGKVSRTRMLEGDLEPARGHYYVIMPQVGWLHLLGFPGKYITVSGRQVAGLSVGNRHVTVNLHLPPSSSVRKAGKQARGTSYTIAAHASSALEVKAEGAEIRRIYSQGELTNVEFVPGSEHVVLTLRRA